MTRANLRDDGWQYADLAAVPGEEPAPMPPLAREPGRRGDDRSGLAGLWLLLAPLACCAGPALIAGRGAGLGRYRGGGRGAGGRGGAGHSPPQTRVPVAGRCGAAVTDGDPRGDR